MSAITRILCGSPSSRHTYRYSSTRRPRSWSSNHVSGSRGGTAGDRGKLPLNTGLVQLGNADEVLRAQGTSRARPWRARAQRHTHTPARRTFGVLRPPGHPPRPRARKRPAQAFVFGGCMCVCARALWPRSSPRPLMCAHTSTRVECCACPACVQQWACGRASGEPVFWQHLRACFDGTAGGR